LPRGGVVAEERDGAVAVGEEVDLATHPNRVRVVGVVAWNLYQVEGLEVDDPDGGGLAAVIALPRGLPLGKGS